MLARDTTVTWNPASANTLAIYAQWGGAGGAAQIIETWQSEFRRTGP